MVRACRVFLMSALAVLCGSLRSWAGPEEDPYVLTRSGWPYPNYARERYELYPAFGGRRAVYDRLGNFVSYGTFGLRWDEVRDRHIQEKLDAGYQINETSSMSRTIEEAFLYGGLSVAHRTYGGQAISFAVGRNMITSFTPLVLYQLGYGGLRIDYSAPQSDLTFLLSRGGLRGAGLFSDLYGSKQGWMEMSPVIVGGAHWAGHFGALDLGMTFFRQAQSNVKGNRESLFRGDVPYPELRSPKLIKVRVTDDSPRDLPGAALYAASIRVTGTDANGERVAYTSSSSQASAHITYDPGLRPQITGRRVGERWEAQGATEGIDVVFTMPPDLTGTSAEITMTISGDYRIGTRQVHDFQIPNSTNIEERSWPSPAPTALHGLYFKDTPLETEPFYTVLRAEGNPDVDGGPKVVRFHHAIPTAQSFYGVNLHVGTKALDLSGEMVYNPQDGMFPTKNGHRRHAAAYAGYLTLLGKWGAMGNLGGEVFQIDPTYGGGYDSRRGGIVLFTDVAGDVRSGDQLGTNALTQEFPVYDDNDDHDVWPDNHVSGVDWMYVPSGPYDEPARPGGRPEGGVYPGLDRDGDLVLDYDKNRNAIEDWREPFLAFDADPPEFVYGMDFNNNLVPDYRENDNEPDYPYRRGEQGIHFFYDLGWHPSWMTRARLGWYRTKAIAGGGQNRAAYARIGASMASRELSIQFRDDLKFVRDDIPDDVYRMVLTTDLQTSSRWNTANNLPPPDILPMRNSFVNTGFLETRWTPYPGLRIENSFKQVLNRRKELEDRSGGRIQDKRTLHHFSMINKWSYTTSPTRRLKVVARMKHLLARWDEGSYTPIDSVAVGNRASWSFTTPSLLLTYTLTSKTRIEFGQFGFFPRIVRAHYHDRVDPMNNFTENMSLLQLTMMGAHEGYNVVANIGVRWRRRDYRASSLYEDVKFSAFFADLMFGPE